MNVDELIDRFVERVDSPESNFWRIESAPGLMLLSQDCRSGFLRRFAPCSRAILFQLSMLVLSLFSNLGDDSHEELNVAIFNDRIIAKTLH